jgi:hypothetical protein
VGPVEAAGWEVKSPAELKANAEKRAPVVPGKDVSRPPRPGSKAYWLERDNTHRSYSVFCFKTLPGGLGSISLVLDGALYQAARECVLKHMVEENAQAVEREYGDAT